MNYVISDVHGMYGHYLAMLERIQFSEADTLYILGDVVDRGDEPIALLQDMMARPNVYPILGNHDLLALDLLKRLSMEITEETIQTQLDATLLEAVRDWLCEGGQPTLAGFRGLEREEQLDLLDYLADFAPYEVVDVMDERTQTQRTFILVHAGLGNFQAGKKLREYTLEELTLSCPDIDTQYFADDSIWIVSGHMPTLAQYHKPQIVQSHHNLHIDCGACFSGGKLACLCLETMEEFYVP